MFFVCHSSCLEPVSRRGRKPNSPLSSVCLLLDRPGGVKTTSEHRLYRNTVLPLALQLLAFATWWRRGRWKDADCCWILFLLFSLCPSQKPKLTQTGISCIIHVYYMTDERLKSGLTLLCSIMYNTHSSFMYCNGFQSSKENGSACVFLKHDLFCTATIPCVCLSSQ